MEQYKVNEVHEIYADKIDEPPNAMRSDIEEEALRELSEDIKLQGLIQPITVRPVCTDCKNPIVNDGTAPLCNNHGVNIRFEIVAGHRRFLACVMARMTKIPCMVREMRNHQVFGVMASENLARQDTNPVDEADFVVKVQKVQQCSISEIAKLVKRTPAWVEQRLTVGKMPDYLKDFLRKKQMTLGVALILNQIEYEPMRNSWSMEAVRSGVSIATARLWLQQYEAQKLPDGSMPSEYSAPAADGGTQIYRTRCDLDGKLYPPSEMRSVMVWRGNYPIIEEVRKELSSESAPPPNAAE